MTFKKFIALMCACLFAAVAIAGEQNHHKVAIAVVDGDGTDSTRIELDHDDLGFELHDLQVGENRSVVDKDGRSILITRVEEGFTFDVDGKTISMPAFDNHGGHHLSDVDVRVMHDGMSAESMDMEGVMIISGKAIDDATQQLIRSTLESAGHNDVNFVGGDEDGHREVRVVKKIVQVTD